MQNQPGRDQHEDCQMRTVPGVVLLQRLHPDPSVPKTTRHITQTTSRAERAEEPSSRRRGPAPCLMNSIHGGGGLRVFPLKCAHTQKVCTA